MTRKTLRDEIVLAVIASGRSLDLSAPHDPEPNWRAADKADNETWQDYYVRERIVRDAHVLWQVRAAARAAFAIADEVLRVRDERK